MNTQFLLLLFLILANPILSQSPSYQLETDIPYYPKSIQESHPYIAERCKLDLYYPTDSSIFATIVYFHGGGLRAGEKEIPKALMEKGVAIVAPNYRLYPKVMAPTYIEDAAAAVAWVFKHIEKFGGDSSKIFVSGHSAGGYLASMVGMDQRWLATHDIDANRIAGLIPFSGHTITHFTVREERGIPGTQVIADDWAPIYHVRPDAPPLTLITGDREMELLGRYEENAFMMRMMKVAGHKHTKLYELDGYGHLMTEPAFPLLLREVELMLEKKN